MNVVFNNDVNTNNSDDLLEITSPQAYYDYDYRNYLQTIIHNQYEQNTGILNLSTLTNLGFSLLTFLFSTFFIYCYVKNLIRK